MVYIANVTSVYTVISLFFVVHIFSDGTRPKISYSNIVSL